MEEIANRLDGIIPLLAGIWAMLAGFKVIPINKDPEKAEAFHKRFGLFLKIGGPLLIAFGVAKSLLIL